MEETLTASLARANSRKDGVEQLLHEDVVMFFRRQGLSTKMMSWDVEETRQTNRKHMWNMTVGCFEGKDEIMVLGPGLSVWS